MPLVTSTEMFKKAYDGGYAMQLEAHLITTALRDGHTPYCHVVEGNEVSLHLQRKMGLTCAELPAIWLD